MRKAVREDGGGYSDVGEGESSGGVEVGGEGGVGWSVGYEKREEEEEGGGSICEVEMRWERGLEGRDKRGRFRV